MSRPDEGTQESDAYPEKGFPQILLVEDDVYVVDVGRGGTMYISRKRGDGEFEVQWVLSEGKEEPEFLRCRSVTSSKGELSFWRAQGGHGGFSIAKRVLSVSSEGNTAARNFFIAPQAPFEHTDKYCYSLNDTLACSDDRSLLLGKYREQHLSLAIWSGELFDIYDKHFSVSVNGDTVGEYQPIEGPGKFGVKNMAVVCDDDGLAHAAWVRSTSPNGMGGKQKHTTAVYYAKNPDGKKWTAPVSLFEGPSSQRDEVGDLAMACGGERLVLMWEAVWEGATYCAEQINGVWAKPERIELQYAREKRYVRALFGSFYDVPWRTLAAAGNGDVYSVDRTTVGPCLLTYRRKGKWEQAVLTTERIDHPAIAIDTGGRVHIAYLREEECYYRELVPSEK